MKTVFDKDSGLALSEAELIGVVSLIFWSLMVVVTLKYVAAHHARRQPRRGRHHGAARAGRLVGGHPAAAASRALLLGVFGAALFYGDGVITPAISVLSAVEGLQIAAPSLAPYVVELTVVVLIALFLFQKRGTAGIGALFGPVMVLWFAVLAAVGDRRRSSAIRRSSPPLNPLAGLGFLLRHGWRRVRRPRLGGARRHRCRGALRRHGALRRQADPHVVVRPRAARARAQLPRPGRPACGPPGGDREPVLQAVPGLGAAADGAARDRRRP